MTALRSARCAVAAAISCSVSTLGLAEPIAQPAMGAPLSLRPLLQPALRDPFTPMQKPAPPPPAPIKAVAPQPEVQAPAPPPIPALNLRFAGRMRSPTGELVVFATQGAQAIALTHGLVLSNGFRVEKVSETAVEFIHPSLAATARLDLPPLPAFEIR